MTRNNSSSKCHRSTSPEQHTQPEQDTHPDPDHCTHPDHGTHSEPNTQSQQGTLSISPSSTNADANWGRKKMKLRSHGKKTVGDNRLEEGNEQTAPEVTSPEIGSPVSRKRKAHLQQYKRESKAHLRQYKRASEACSHLNDNDLMQIACRVGSS